jgi:hypothetical protein
MGSVQGLIMKVRDIPSQLPVASELSDKPDHLLLIPISHLAMFTAGILNLRVCVQSISARTPRSRCENSTRRWE